MFSVPKLGQNHAVFCQNGAIHVFNRLSILWKLDLVVTATVPEERFEISI